MSINPIIVNFFKFLLFILFYFSFINVQEASAKSGFYIGYSLVSSNVEFSNKFKENTFDANDNIVDEPYENSLGFSSGFLAGYSFNHNFSIEFNKMKTANGSKRNDTYYSEHSYEIKGIDLVAKYPMYGKLNLAVIGGLAKVNGNTVFIAGEDSEKVSDIDDTGIKYGIGFSIGDETDNWNFRVTYSNIDIDDTEKFILKSANLIYTF